MVELESLLGGTTEKIFLENYKTIYDSVKSDFGKKIADEYIKKEYALIKPIIGITDQLIDDFVKNYNQEHTLDLNITKNLANKVINLYKTWFTNSIKTFNQLLNSKGRESLNGIKYKMIGRNNLENFLSLISNTPINELKNTYNDERMNQRTIRQVSDLSVAEYVIDCLIKQNFIKLTDKIGYTFAVQSLNKDYGKELFKKVSLEALIKAAPQVKPGQFSVYQSISTGFMALYADISNLIRQKLSTAELENLNNEAENIRLELLNTKISDYVKVKAREFGLKSKTIKTIENEVNRIIKKDENNPVKELSRLLKEKDNFTINLFIDKLDRLIQIINNALLKEQGGLI